MAPNKALIFAKFPNGFPIAGEDIVVTSTSFDPKAAAPEGGVILKTLAISYDPYLRGKMRPTGSGYVAGFKLNEPLNNNAISRVVTSSNPRLKTGDVVIGYSNFQEYVVVPKAIADNEADPSGQGGLSILKNPLGLDPLLFLGALGMSGLTAYSSFYEIGKPKKGDTIFVSAASGAVGQIVGQLAKREGLKVIGSVGSDKKLKFITEELGFDVGFNYKSEKPAEGLKRALAEIGSEGLDIYYDNVGGEQLDVSIAAMNTFGRISRSTFHTSTT
jgi:NADPH-dependent curcumin reductase CurA